MQDITVCCVSNTSFVSVHSWLSFRVSLMFISLCIEYLLYNKSSLKNFNMVQILVRVSVWMLVNANLAMFQLHSDTLFWFRADKSLLFLLNVACLAEKHQIPI